MRGDETWDGDQLGLTTEECWKMGAARLQRDGGTETHEGGRWAGAAFWKWSLRIG